MARVRRRGTDAELRVGRVLRALGHGYRVDVRSLPGSPDFANRRRKWAVFVNGCFWHRHTNCGKAKIPGTNSEFWRAKFSANRRRDAKAVRELRRANFRVIVIWECETLDAERLKERFSKVLEPRRVDMAETVDH